MRFEKECINTAVSYPVRTAAWPLVAKKWNIAFFAHVEFIFFVVIITKLLFLPLYVA